MGATASWPPPEQLSFWMPVYVGLALGCGVAVYLRSVLTMVVMGQRACAKLYAELSDAVFGAPTSFFDSTPTGRILNRFTSDTEQMDNLLMQNMQQWLNCVMPVIGTLCLIAVVSPVFLAWVLPLVVLYLALMRYSAPATRDLQRLEATSRSPIFSQFSETLAGLTTIRAFGAAPRFAAHSKTLVDANTRCFYTQFVRAVGCRSPRPARLVDQSSWPWCSRWLHAARVPHQRPRSPASRSRTRSRCATS